jgi:UDP-N-acetylmuramate--alanine ligase
MGGIAEVLLNLGYAVQGSDSSANAVTAAADTARRAVHIGHDAENVERRRCGGGLDRGGRDNPEVLRRSSNRKPVVPRAEMLGELMRFRMRSRSPAPTARPPPPASWPACWPRAARTRPS